MSHQEQIVVTGVNGFVGEHLSRYLSELGYPVRGIAREALASTSISSYLAHYTQADFLDKTAISSIDFTGARGIVHLAGLASVSESFKKPDLFRRANAEMVDNLLSAALAQGFKGRVVVISTGAIYESPQEMPLTEASSIKASSPYAEGKIRAEEVAREYRTKGLDVVIARPFNHIGPGQVKGFLVPDLYAEMVLAKAKGEKTILVGNLETRRDYTDVRDIVKAYEKLVSAETLSFDTYNVCSGTSYSGEQIFQELKEAMSSKVEAIVDATRVRPTDAMEIIGDSSRLRKETGWLPSIELAQTIRDFVERR